MSWDLKFKISPSFYTVKNGSREKVDMGQNKNSEGKWNEDRMNGRRGSIQ